MKKLLLSIGIILASAAGNNLMSQTTFNYTGGMETYTVPAGVTTITVECWGAEGVLGLGAAGGTGGLGGYSAGELSVTPGQTINIFVGGQDGYNGGGIGGDIGAGNGGGASDVRVGGTTLGDRVIVAGGGGGGGATGCTNDLAAGNGGYGGGGAGTDGASSADGFGGFGGTVGAGGGAGLGCPGYLGLPGLADGTGGDGQGCCCSTTPGGGGGGGGYVTGGGGGGGSAGTPGCSGNDKGGGGGGAGGSSWTGALANDSINDGIQSADGMIMITPVCTAASVDITVTSVGTLLTANEVNATYQWLDCDNGNAAIMGETNQSYTPTLTGNYAVELTVGNCVDTSACFLVDFTGIIDLTKSPASLVKIIDITGRETEFKPNTVLFYIYSDGTIRRVMEIVTE